MAEKIKRIAEFISSIEEGTIESSSVLIGGAKKKDKGLLVKNDGDCTNTKFESCNHSENTGTCLNARSVCADTVNGQSCYNGYNPNMTAK